MRILEDCSHRHGELFSARSTFVNALANRTLAFRICAKFVNRFLFGVLAMRANWAVRPAQGFEKFPRFVIAGILLSQLNQVQFLWIHFRFHAYKLHANLGFVKYISPAHRRVACLPVILGDGDLKKALNLGALFEQVARIGYFARTVLEKSTRDGKRRKRI